MELTNLRRWNRSCDWFDRLNSNVKSNFTLKHFYWKGSRQENWKKTFELPVRGVIHAHEPRSKCFVGDFQGWRRTCDLALPSLQDLAISDIRIVLEWGCIICKHTDRWLYLSQMKMPNFVNKNYFWIIILRSRLTSATSNAIWQWYRLITTILLNFYNPRGHEKGFRVKIDLRIFQSIESPPRTIHPIGAVEVV